MHCRGGIYQTTVVCTYIYPLELHPAMALYNKNGWILYYKVKRLLLRRYLIKYKAY